VTGAFHPANALPVGTTESATLSVYREEQGGTPVWQETQNVNLDPNGLYNAMLGITQKDGVPVDLFSSTEPRWIGVQFNRPGEMEEPRVQLVSVPYALKSLDAETLGGKPASAYLLAPASNIPADATQADTLAVSPNFSPKSKSMTPHTATGNTNYVAKFTDSVGDLGNSAIFEASGFAGIGTASPLAPLHVNGGAASTPNITGYLYGSTSTGNFVDLSGFLRTKATLTVGNNWFNTTGNVLNVYSAAQDGILFARADGKVGAGTTNPLARLHSTVGAGATGQIAGLFYRSTTANSTFTDEFGFARTAATRTVGNNWSNSNGNVLNVYSAAGDGLLFVNGAGRVGIGTTTPGSKMDVAGDINMSGSLLLQGQNVLQLPGPVTDWNLAVGVTALSNTTGVGNTAIGAGALEFDMAGSSNTATGFDALAFNSSGVGNTATGSTALQSNTIGGGNTAAGISALFRNTTGTNNTASGNSNNIHIGSVGSPTDNGTIRIGGNTSFGDPVAQTQFFAAGIRGTTTGSNNAIPVVIDSNGQLGTISSSRRFKQDIQDMGDTSNGLRHLRPVTFRYQKPFADGSKPIQYGLIAEEVAEVYPDLVARSADGQIETVKYQVLDSMLLNEVQRLNKENQALKERLSRLEAVMANVAGGAGLQ
jgi:hypothetical protein